MMRLGPRVPQVCLARAQALLDTGKRCILGIAAQPGAGKSTLAALLAEQLGPATQVVPMDGFHLADAELERLGRAARKGAPDTFDADGYIALLRRVRRQSAEEVIYAPCFDRALEAAIAGSIAVWPKTRLVITEGNYLLLDVSPWSLVRQCLDESWYLCVDDDFRREQLLRRHMHHGRSEAQARTWIDSTDEPNADLIARYVHRADHVVRWD